MDPAVVLEGLRAKIARGEKLTYGDELHPAMEVQTPEEAGAYLAGLIKIHVDQYGGTEDAARSVILQNIGYFTGYYDNATARRVMRCFDTSHPIFGRSRPSPEEALAAGVAMAQ